MTECSPAIRSYFSAFIYRTVSEEYFLAPQNKIDGDIKK